MDIKVLIKLLTARLSSGFFVANMAQVEQQPGVIIHRPEFDFSHETLMLLPEPELSKGSIEIDPTPLFRLFLREFDQDAIDVNEECSQLYPLVEEIKVSIRDLNELKEAQNILQSPGVFEEFGEVQELIEEIVKPLPELIEEAWQAYEESNQGENLHAIYKVLGGLGGGKTSLAESLTEALPGSTLFEELTDREDKIIYPWLGLFYPLQAQINENPENLDLQKKMHHLQLFVQAWYALSRFRKELKAVIQSQYGPVFIEAPLPLDTVYMHAQKERGEATEENYKNYMELIQGCLKILPPVRFIYIHNGVYSVQTLIDRVRKRDKKEELKVLPEYLGDLLRNGSRLVKTLAKSEVDLLVIVNSEELNFSDENEDRVDLAKMVLGTIGRN